MRVLICFLLGFLLLGQLSAVKSQPVFQKPAKRVAEVEGAARFTPAERHMIRAYLAEQDRRSSKDQFRNLPYGLQKKVSRGKPLPPGWQKKVVIGHSLDYQIYRYGSPLPQGLLSKLPPGPTGTQIIQIDDSIIRFDSATRMVLDIFDLIQAGL